MSQPRRIPSNPGLTARPDPAAALALIAAIGADVEAGGAAGRDAAARWAAEIRAEREARELAALRRRVLPVLDVLA